MTCHSQTGPHSGVQASPSLAIQLACVLSTDSSHEVVRAAGTMLPVHKFRYTRVPKGIEATKATDHTLTPDEIKLLLAPAVQALLGKIDERPN